MKSTAVVFLLATITPQCSAGLLGGWTEHDPYSNPKYMELAHFAISQQTTGLTHYNTILKLLKVETQVVAGMNYRLIFEAAPSNCAIADVPYSSEHCKPTTNQGWDVCTVIVSERSWENYREVTCFRCLNPNVCP